MPLYTAAPVFLSDPNHRSVFHFTPKHASWLNQIEIWFSILALKVLRRGDFLSLPGLERKITELYRILQQHDGQAILWTYQGKLRAS